MFPQNSWVGRPIVAAFLLWPVLAGAQPPLAVTLQGDTTVEVTWDGQLFTRYLTQSGSRPVLWPIMGPGGVEMTRGYPMRAAAEGETTDHVHQRSLWFSHGDVNGVDFWSEPPEGNTRRNLGRVEHGEFLRISAEAAPHISTRNAWRDGAGEKLLSDYRDLSFGGDASRRWIDFDIRLVADAGQSVTFGDTKEGTFGVRVAPWLRVDSQQGGRIVNSLGQSDKEAWGKAAPWVDYHGQHAGRQLGLAVLNHPSSFRFPTFWHVRTYGLFAANPFGRHNFLNSEDEDGSYELAPGESLVFSYRVLIHTGDEQAGRVPEAFVDYAKADKSALLENGLPPASPPAAEE